MDGRANDRDGNDVRGNIGMSGAAATAFHDHEISLVDAEGSDTLSYDVALVDARR